MKKFILFFLISIIANADQIFTIDRKKINFYHEKELHITASEKCIKLKQKCSNFTFLEKLSQKELKKNSEKNAESLRMEICSKQLNGQIFVGLDSASNQNSFCYLKDQNLYIDIGTLNYYAKKNDGVVSENLGFSKKRREKSKIGN
jgi:hypothetical protein